MTANFTLPEQVESLQKQLTAAKQNHEKEISELVDEAEDLRYSLSLTRSDLRNETRKVAELRVQLADIRRMIAHIGERLNSRETHTSTGSLEDQLIDTQGFISTVSAELQDGIRETIELFRRRNPAGSDSD
ncbi:hypothetical protein C8F04DRAFT_1185204 [Mycena alexandri]|uniref:Uncharacterized protein n=1 Tax=Mycena alexandri TaxID=1745969 RepID=A0AAD6X4R9_9AGAR|nr:hypothetical protein C8F04DRAFT_1185204 [Mycena alexandri]